MKRSQLIVVDFLYPRDIKNYMSEKIRWLYHILMHKL